MQIRAEMQWQWRVYVPEADRFAITVGTGMVPKEGFDGVRNGGSLPLPAGETIVHASVFRDYRGELVFRVERPGVAFKTELKGEHADWLNSPHPGAVPSQEGVVPKRPVPVSLSPCCDFGMARRLRTTTRMGQRRLAGAR